MLLQDLPRLFGARISRRSCGSWPLLGHSRSPRASLVPGSISASPRTRARGRRCSPGWGSDRRPPIPDHLPAGGSVHARDEADVVTPRIGQAPEVPIPAEHVVHAPEVIEMAEVRAAAIAGVVAPDLQALMVAAAMIAGVLESIDDLQDAVVVGQLRGGPGIAPDSRLELPQHPVDDHLPGTQPREPTELVDVMTTHISGRIRGLGDEVLVEGAARSNVGIRFDHGS